MNLHLVVLIAYSVVLIAGGLWVGRLVRGSADFFVAGRSLGPGLLFATVMAANIGAGSTVGAASLGYQYGLSAWWWVGSAGIGTLLLAFFVGPRIHRLAAKHGFYTVGDFLEHRYGTAVRGVMTALLWMATPAILAGQLIALSVVLEVVVGFPRVPALLLGGLVTTTYFTAGGLRGAAWINLAQLVVLIIGFAAALVMALYSVGGWSGMAAVAPSVGVGDDYFNFWHGGGAGWTLLALVAPNFIVSPGLLQKVYGARDTRSIRLGVGLCGLALLVFAFAPAVLGMVARMHHPDLINPDHALPMLLRSDLPVWVGAVGLGALFVADISSADAILFMLATSMSQDLYRRFINPQASDRRVLFVARVAAVLGGVVAVGMAIVSTSVVASLRIFYSLVGLSFFVPVVAGLYRRRGGAPEVFASIAAGIATDLTVRLATDGAGFGVVTPNLAGLIAAGAGFTCVAVARSLRGRATAAKTDETR
ncbi:MAG: sodium:solute symporter family protein [Gemmatimonadetes bacterium]|nr:sodium:solute symporter family protein [Gemmatimonadota bacterium]